MQDRLERLIKLVYQRWKSIQPKSQGTHPNEEDIACFLEDKLSKAESQKIKMHLISCDACAESFAIQLRLKPPEVIEIPKELVVRMKDLIPEDKIPILEIFLKLKEKILDILSTTGDVLVGQELVPAPLLRSRKIKDFKDEVTILKDFEDLRVEAKIENKLGQAFDLTVIIKEKASQKTIKDLRVTLIKDDLELESYLSDAGKVTFEHLLLGRYTVEISSIEKKVASILLEIKK